MTTNEMSNQILPELDGFVATSSAGENLSPRQALRATMLGKYRAACQVAIEPILTELLMLREQRKNFFAYVNTMKEAG